MDRPPIGIFCGANGFQIILVVACKLWYAVIVIRSSEVNGMGTDLNPGNSRFEDICRSGAK